MDMVSGEHFIDKCLLNDKHLTGECILVND